MLRIDRNDHKLTRLGIPSFQEAGLAERYDLQKMICSSPSAFFEEVKEHLLLIGEEVQPSSLVGDRIDLLAIDKAGQIVIIELKRGREKLQMLQAISYAAMIADWPVTDIIRRYAEFSRTSFEEATQAIEEFLDEGTTECLNRTQRVVLCAEEFDYALLMSAKWLSEKYKVGVRCYRLALAADQQTEYLACSRIFPPPELEDHARRVRMQPAGTSVEEQKTWEGVLAQMTNPDFVEFFRQQLAAGCHNKIYHQQIFFYLGTTCAFSVNARKNYARVVQKRRFDDDIEFWKQKLSDQEEVTPIKDGRQLRFYLKTKADIDTFMSVYTKFKGTPPEFRVIEALPMDAQVEDNDESE
jgi:hypothetical protein